jgi:hypothetical protein
MENAEIDEDVQYEVLYNLMDYIKSFDKNDTPAENSTRAILKAYEMIGVNDPYERAKKESNDAALLLYPKLKNIVENSNDSLYKALKIAVAGNIIDLGINRDYDINKALHHSLEVGFAKDDYILFEEKLRNVREVLFLGDNAGEIVFDKILVEEMIKREKKVVYAVKEGPILNDATIHDAAYVGMDRIAEIITTGSNYLGVSVNQSSPDFLEKLRSAELVLSKGQANFESLEGKDLTAAKVFFLLKIKCEGVGRVAQAEFGDIVFIAG